jgi:hypothetical protein
MTAVAVITAEFDIIARAVATNAGWPELRVFQLPYPLETCSEEEVRQVAGDHWPAFLEAIGAT